MNYNINRFMKKEKKKRKKTTIKNWIGDQCSETEENLWKKQQEGIPTPERLDHCETGESDYCPRSFRKMPHRRTTNTELMDRILL